VTCPLSIDPAITVYDARGLADIPPDFRNRPDDLEPDGMPAFTDRVSACARRKSPVRISLPHVTSKRRGLAPGVSARARRMSSISVTSSAQPCMLRTLRDNRMTLAVKVIRDLVVTPRRFPAVGVLAVTVCAGIGIGCARRAPLAETIVLAVADRANAHVTLASERTRVTAVWAATGTSGTDIYLATSDDGGARFGPPVRVNDVDADATANGEQPPRVAVHGPDVSVLWVSKRGATAVIRSASSSDGGKTFAAARTITPAGVTGARGWESATISDAGVVHAAWLDGRNAAQSHAQHAPGAAHHHGGGDMRQDIFHATWHGTDAPVEGLVATNVCFCCKTAIVTRGDDVFVAWRHLFDGGVRDIAIARSTDGGRTFSAPVRVSPDNWKIDACPDDGPALALAPDGRLHVVWPTLVNDSDKPRVGIFHAVSADGGRTFSPRERVDGTRGTDPAHPRMIVDDSGEPVFAWDELTAGRRQVALRRGPEPVQVISTERAGSYPAIAAAGEQLVVAWTDQSGERATISLRRVPSSPR
jgi:hypothetical protein